MMNYDTLAKVLKPGGYPVVTADPLVLIGWKNRRTGKMRYGRYMSLEDYDLLMQNDYSNAPAYPVVVGKTYFKPMLKHEIAMPPHSYIKQSRTIDSDFMMYIEACLQNQGFAVTVENGKVRPTVVGRPIMREFDNVTMRTTYYQPAAPGRDYAPGVRDR